MRLLPTPVFTLSVFAVLAFAVLALPLAPAAEQTLPAQAPVLPTVSAYALDRAKVTLPNDFRAPRNLLLISFQRDQQPVVDGWITALSGRTVQTWWLPISAHENGVYRWWLNASLRGSLSASQSRHYAVPLYVNKGQFLKTLQIPSEQDVVVLLTDKSGRVLWRASGAESDSKKAGLDNFLERPSNR